MMNERLQILYMGVRIVRLASERERNNRVIDMLIALTVDELSERLGRDLIDVMPEFIGSRTA